MPTIKFKFSGNQTKRPSTLFTDKNTFQEISFGYHIVTYLESGDRTERGTSSINNICSFGNHRISVFIVPLISSQHHFFTSQGHMFLRYRIVIRKRSQRGMKKFSPFTGLSHMGDDSCYQFFIFVFRVLFVEDTVFLPFESNTTKKMMTVEHTEEAVHKVRAMPAEPRKQSVGSHSRISSDAFTFVRKLRTDPEICHIHTIRIEFSRE